MQDADEEDGDWEAPPEKDASGDAPQNDNDVGVDNELFGADSD